MLRFAFLLAILLPFGAASAEDIITLSTRGGVTQSYLLSVPASGKALAVAILFPGGAGKTDLERETSRKVLDRGNFLVRARQLFAGQSVAAAVVDAPSDQPSGMEDGFRLAAAHAEDIGKVVEDLKKRFPGVPVFLVGTSRGTISAAAIGARLGKAVDGIVLTSSVLVASGGRRVQPGLSGFDFSTIPAPVLFVHHVDDGCGVSPFSAASRMADRFPLIKVGGGSPPQSDPCQAMSYHGYLGKEAETVEAIAKWMLKQPYPREIN